MVEGHLDLIRNRRKAAESRAREARRRAGIARFREANASDPLTASLYAAEAAAHERAVELQEQAAASQHEHEVEATA
ncbi:MAG: hypothetical protein ACJ766_05355 [Thermoleophilaceae bacterium]|jgi:hypothetical protein